MQVFTKDLGGFRFIAKIDWENKTRIFHVGLPLIDGDNPENWGFFKLISFVPEEAESECEFLERSNHLGQKIRDGLIACFHWLDEMGATAGFPLENPPLA